MSTPTDPATCGEFQGLDEPLTAQLPTFELFFKTFGFKRVHGRIWGLLVLAGQPLSSREISCHLQLSQGATSTSLNELAEWGAVQSEFDPNRRCHLHSPVGNTLSIVATVFRRREQVAFGKFKTTAEQCLVYVRDRYGERDPRVLSLRSIISSCEIAEAVMQLIFSSVERALGDSESILARAVQAALRVGVQLPARLRLGPDGTSRDEARRLAAQVLREEGLLEPLEDDEDEDDELAEAAPARATERARG